MDKGNWTYRKLGEVAEIINGKNQKSVETVNGKYPICGSGGVMGYASDYLCPENTIIIGRKGNINNPIFMKEKFWNVDTAFGIVANDSMNPKFLFYFCKDYDFEKHNVAVTIPSLRKMDLLEISVPVPPLEIQSRIIAELDCISTILEKKRQQLKELDNLAQAIFYDMFGDPVENEKGWDTFPLSQNVEEMFLGPFGSALKIDSYVPKENSFCMVYEQKHAIKARMDFEDTHFINEEKYNSLKRFEVREGDFIMSCRGTIGKVFQLPQGAPIGIIHPSVMKIRIKDAYNPIFFREILIKTVSNENTNGNCVQMAITAKELGSRKVILPPLSLQQSFAAKIEAIEKQKERISQSIKEVQTLFDSRMEEYFG